MSYFVFLALAPIAILLLAWVGVASWQRRQLPESYALLTLSLMCSGWITFSSIELLATSPEWTYRFAQLGYPFIAFASTAWLAFAWTFTGRGHWLRSRLFKYLLGFQAVTIALAFTNPLHGLIWASVEYVPVGDLLGFRVQHGPWFYLFALHGWATTCTGSVLIVREYAHAYRGMKQLSMFAALGAALPVFYSVLYVGQVLPIRKDFTPIVTAVGAMFMGISISRYRLLTYRPVARGTLVEGMHEGMLALDPLDRIVDVNPALNRIFAGGGTLLGRPVGEVLPPKALAFLASPDAGAASEITLGQGAYQRQYDLRVSPLRGRSGGVSGRLVLLHDVTDRRVAEDALRVANTELEARNEDLDAFARTVAHDLKNPISAIQGYAELLQDDADMPAEVRAECVDTILRTAQHMDGIVQALLLLAGVNRQPVTPEPVRMDAVVTRALERVAPLAQRHGAHLRVPEVWPDVLGYGPWLEEVWMNYLTNAVKYGGRPPHITLGADVLADGCVRFWVQDAGPGLSPELCARLFQPFTRVGDLDEEGHGLGLSIVRRIVERLGGTAGVESSGVLGEGCRFYFTLPVVTAQDCAAEALMCEA